MKMIVVLDGYAMNPGDLSFAGLEALGDCTVYDFTRPEEVISRAQDAEMVLTNKTRLTAEMIAAMPKLEYIGVLATGYNNVDIEAARQRGIVVANVPAYSTASVAQLAFAHILNITMQVQHHSEEVHKGRWMRNRDFCFWDNTLIELEGKTIGLVGFGNTGQATAAIALGFGMKVLAYTSKSQDKLPKILPSMVLGKLAYTSKSQDKLPKGVCSVSLDELFSSSDIVSLHCPLTPETRGLVNAERIAQMKSTAILINTSRGPVVDEQALADALNAGRWYAAGVDVLSSEPPKADNPLLTAKNCYITPHIAWATKEARERLMAITTENVRAFLDGHPINDVTRK